MSEDDGCGDIHATIEAYRVLWQNTQNPLFVWDAMALCSTIPMRRLWSKKKALPATPPHAESFPDWIMAYLSVFAGRVSALAEGRDYRLAPAPFGDAASGDAVAFEKFLDSTGTIAADDATNLSLHALGLRRDGGNAFKDYQALRRKQLDMLSFEELKHLRHMSYDKAIDQVAEEAGIERRRLQARLADVRKAEKDTSKPIG